MQNLKRILANTSLFRELEGAQLDAIACATEPIRARANTCVIKQGDPSRGVFLVVYGQVKISFDRQDGSEKTLVILGQGKCFGLGEMLLDRAHPACVRTISDTMLLHVAREKVLETAENNPRFAQELMFCIGRQSYTLMRDIESYSLQTAKQRLTGYLLRQSHYQGSDCVQLAGSKTLIASRLNLTPETLSRLLRELAADAMVAVNGRRIKILDYPKMDALLTG